jgi:hypothetical protein
MKASSRASLVPIILIAVAIGSCDQLPDRADLTGTYVGSGRNGLCIDAPIGSRDLYASIETYSGHGGSCSLDAGVHVAGDEVRMTARDNPSCQFDAQIVGGAVTLPKQLPAACAHYCSGGAKMEGASFQYSDEATHKEMHGTIRDPSGQSVC